MSQIIDFSKFHLPSKRSINRMKIIDAQEIQPTLCISDDEYKMTMNILVHNNPNKTNFTYSEAASLLNVKNEFIRRRAKSGLIRVTYFGDKPMIHISELARLLTKGIK